MSKPSEEAVLGEIAARRKRGITDLRAELQLRIDELGTMALDTVERQLAFREVFDAFRPPHFDLYALPDSCAVAVADHTIAVRGVIVDTANGQAVGELARTLALDQRIATHDYLTLQQPYRAHGLAPILLSQSFDFY